MNTHPSLSQQLHPLAPLWSCRNRVFRQRIPMAWRDWLYDRGSLTVRLQKLQPGSFHVQVRRQYCGRPTALEQATLQLSSQARVWVREVALHAAGAECVLARTVVPLTALQGRLRCLQQLGNRSLGSFLFRQPSLVRHPIQVSQCASDSPLAWCRYSVFGLYGERVLVSEGFHATMVNTEMTHN